jgi:DNA-damage-inducible protein J
VRKSRYNSYEVIVMLKTQPQTSRISVRIAPELKTQVEEIFSDLGLSTSEAITLFFNQVRINEGLPFNVRRGHTPKPETLALIERIESGEEELVGPFATKEELWRSLGI